MAGARRRLAESETIVMDDQIIAAMRRAALSRDTVPVVQLADSMIAENITARTRPNILANAWFHTALLYGLEPGRPFMRFGLHLVGQGWCTDEDMEDGIAERLFVLGTVVGSLPGWQYDWMVETGRHRVLRRFALDHIERVSDNLPNFPEMNSRGVSPTRGTPGDRNPRQG